MNKKAFTLLEIIISTVIMALVTAGLAHIFVIGKRRIIYTRSKMQTAELGRLFLDPLQKDVRQDLWLTNCLGAETGCPGAESLDGITYTPTYTIDDILMGGTNPSLRKVTVTISWDEPVQQ